MSVPHKVELRMRGPSLVVALKQPCTSAMAPRGSRPRLRQTAGEQAVMSERSNNGLSRPAQVPHGAGSVSRGGDWVDSEWDRVRVVQVDRPVHQYFLLSSLRRRLHQRDITSSACG